MKYLSTLTCYLMVLNFAFAKANSQQPPQQFKGFYDFTYDDSKGTILLEVKELDKEFLYVHSLSTGLGSNDIGLDRGQLGDGVVVKWIKAGNKLLLVQPNLKYRAITDNDEERQSVEEAFARSVLYGFEIKNDKKEKTAKETTYTIDLTPFLMEDAHGVVDRLKSRNEGSYKNDKSRSALWMENTKAFPKNVEFEAMLTFTGEPKGRNLRSVAPDANSVTVIQHHSFVELPDDGFEPRAFHPRSGSFYTSYMDYSSPIGTPMEKRWITRHRLEKKNPQAAVSEAVEPIIYYLDPGTPEPVRSALLEGASWWNQAYESAGYSNAFQVKMLPADADPMDLRYNLIQWVHRSTRGWSYGGSITDPRTGEILKGHVSLGSLRIRQDYMLAQGMLEAPFANGKESPEMLKMALARIRQLGAHEVGHTLGFAHNYAASVSDRSSVMDYPHPKYDLVNGIISLADAYDTGIGEWDKLTVQYSYGTPEENETEKDFLLRIIKKAEYENLQFISDSDARAASGAHAEAHLWDGGEDAVEELNRMMQIRKVAMKQFGLDNIPDGQPLSVLEDVFVPVYFSHRYQVEAASKVIGGMRYSYAIKGDAKFEYVSKKEQEAALEALLATLEPENLKIPEDLLQYFPPRAYGYNRDRESFKSETGVAFDPIAAAVTSAEVTIDFMLNATRLNRIAQQGIYGKNLELGAMMNQLTDQIFDAKTSGDYETLIARRLQELYLSKLLIANNSSQLNLNVKSKVKKQIDAINNRLLGSKDDHDVVLHDMIKAAQDHPENIKAIPVMDIPDGSPIGSCGM
ncbi:peptidase [Nonlabens sp. YIK11]|uniref:zinc-dependent metalloprotease n=1 Tax=Nonlabens sp. YIK11 TaxID=1453349 RepID=UPI0006DCB8CB|nr:zinc-dependent metalloprotease [Nonlabens sp. YIK11]KQC33764.1 peptidase [Nonlabens sp. YIK11]